MKKPKSDKRPKQIKLKPKLNSFVGVFVVLATALAGAVTLHFSLAAIPTSGLKIAIYDANNGRPLPNITVFLSPGTPQTPSCTTDGAVTGSDGMAQFSGCQIYNASAPSNGVYYIRSVDAAGRGYYIAPNSPKHVGNDAGGQVTTAEGWNPTWTVTLLPLDTDGDGVKNSAAEYPPRDNCPNTAGPASNNGCPIPPPPPTPTPTPKPPATTTPPASTTKPPSSSSNSSSSAKKPSTTAKATAPAVVVATQGDTTPPSSPENLTISQSEDGLFLSWDDAADNVGVTGYNIERSGDAENWTSLTTNLSDSFYTDIDLADSDFYYYRVQAVDAAGNLSEGALGNIELASSSNGESSAKSKSAAPAAKKSNAGLVAGLTIGVIFVLLAIVGAFLLMRRRMLNSTDPYAYDVSNMANGGISPVTVMPGSGTQHQAMNQPQYDIGPPAQHTSVSLKDMVMEEMNRHGQNQPPLPPQPPHPPAPQ